MTGKFNSSVLILLLLPVLTLTPAIAGDEDLMSPYMQFDPETGFFIPIESAEHDNRANTQPADSSVQPTATGVPEQLTIEQATDQTWLIALVIVMISAGIIWFYKSRKR
jgi:hypothetical protein